jgi:hypothetical protein
MTTAFQPNAFQPDAFQEHAGVTGANITIVINGVQEGDSGLLTIFAKKTAEEHYSGGYWPEYGYVRRKRVRREEPETVPETPEQITARLAAAQQRIARAKVLRQAEQRDREITAQLRAIYQQQDEMLLNLEQINALVEGQAKDDEDLALLLALAS